MTSAIAWAGMTWAQLASVVRSDVSAACRLAAGGEIAARIYLYRRGQLEVDCLPWDGLLERARCGFVRPRFIPLLICAGGVEIIGLAFLEERRGSPEGRVIAVHVLTATRHESCEADIRRTGQKLAALGPWRPGSPGSLSDTAVREIRAVLAGEID